MPNFLWKTGYRSSFSTAIWLSLNNFWITVDRTEPLNDINHCGFNFKFDMKVVGSLSEFDLRLGRLSYTCNRIDSSR